MNKQFAHNQASNHLMCRNLRHAWDISRFRAVTKDEAQEFSLLKWDQAIVRELTCFRCECTKLEFFARDERTIGFVRVKGLYQYPKGYLYKGSKDEERPDRWDYFTELLERRS